MCRRRVVYCTEFDDILSSTPKVTHTWQLHASGRSHALFCHSCTHFIVASGKVHAHSFYLQCSIYRMLSNWGHCGVMMDVAISVNHILPTLHTHSTRPRRITWSSWRAQRTTKNTARRLYCCARRCDRRERLRSMSFASYTDGALRVIDNNRWQSLQRRCTTSKRTQIASARFARCHALHAPLEEHNSEIIDLCNFALRGRVLLIWL